MNFSDILSAEGMCAIVMIGSLVLIVRSLLAFTRQSAEINPQLRYIEAEITKLRNGLSGRKENVEKLTAAVDPLREREARLRAYCDQLRDIELEHERSIAKQEQEQEAERAKCIRRRKIGLK